MNAIVKICLLAIFINFISVTARADEVTFWSQVTHERVKAAGISAVAATRAGAIVHASVFDAVNGIERRYAHIRVAPAAPPGASKRAAAIQAAYASLVKLFPAQTATLDTIRAQSLADIASGEAVEHSQSIARGIQWGQFVADSIWSWRLADGMSTPTPPFTGGTAVGQWRPTPPAHAAGAAPQLGNVTPWFIPSATYFPLPGPPSLSSAKYASDVNEVKLLGSATSPTRTADQTLVARFWNSSTGPNYVWGRVAVTLGEEHHMTLSENARLHALTNMAMADAAIAIWKAKYTYQFWRPVTAIALADTDGNPGTMQDSSWIPLMNTPAYPEYPSGFVGISAAATAVLASYFGEQSALILDSNGMPGVTRYHPSFSSALDELVNSRIFAGFHFRSANEDSRELGEAVGNYMVKHALKPLHGNHGGSQK